MRKFRKVGFVVFRVVLTAEHGIICTDNLYGFFSELAY